MAFTTVMTTTSDVDGSIIEAYDKAFLLATGQDANLDQVVTVKKEINAKSISFPVYNRATVTVAALTENEDVTSTALVDAPVVLTPEEHGFVITRTALASVQTGGVADLAAAEVVGDHMGRYRDSMIIAALSAISTNTLTINNTSKASIGSTEIATRQFLNRFYNKLARANVPTFAGGMYVMIAHDDVISDLRNDTQAGSWQDVSKYADPATVLANEVGSICGFRVIRNNNAGLIDADAGASSVDTYDSYFLGKNALGKAVSKEPRLEFSQTDKLNRFLNMGWTGIFTYGLVDTAAAWKGVCASSVGSN